VTIRHIVLFKFTAGTSGQQVAELSAGLNSLPVSVPEIRAYRHGPDAGILDTSWDYAVIGDFDSAEEFFTYREHPLHQKLIREHVEPIPARPRFRPARPGGSPPWGAGPRSGR
jgi:hypothetical protein